MGKVLIIAEKKSLGAQIAKGLGAVASAGGSYYENENVIVAMAQGHLVKRVPKEEIGKSFSELPTIPSEFVLEPIPTTIKLINVIRDLIKRDDVTEVCNGCDPGREGELIGTLIYEYLRCKKSYSRMWATTQTPKGIQEAFKNRKLSSEYAGLLDSAKSRTEADWIVGINMSRSLTLLKKKQTGGFSFYSAGRVQTPTLAKVVDRELDIRNFVVQPYWEVGANFSCDGNTYEALLVNDFSSNNSIDGGDESPEDEDQNSLVSTNNKKFLKEEDAKKIIELLKQTSPTSVEDIQEEQIVKPKNLFSLTSLQALANKKFKYSLKHTLSIVQSLYERGFCTYPRSESETLGEDSVEKVRETLQQLGQTQYACFSEKILNNNWIDPKNKTVFNSSKLEDGHGAIVPTEIVPSDDQLVGDEKNLYDLIVRQFLAIFYPNASFYITKRITKVSSHIFISQGKTKKEEGWHEIFPEKSTKDEELRAIQDLNTLKSEGYFLLSKKTQPPARYSPGTLGTLMKRLNLGTPATRDNILENLLGGNAKGKAEREPYLTIQNNHLIPTTSGEELISFVRANNAETIASVEMTSDWEEKLKLMEKRILRKNAFMHEIDKWIKTSVAAIKIKFDEMPTAEEKKLADCPINGCDGHIVLRGKEFKCNKECGFRFWGEILGRKFSTDEFLELLKHRKSLKVVDGFISKKTNKKFSANIEFIIKEDRSAEVNFVFEKNPSGQSSSADYLKALCPICNQKIMVINSKYPVAKCIDDKCTFKVFTTISQRKLSNNELDTLIVEKYLSTRTGFISAKNKPFDAALRLTKEFKIEFEFK